MNYQSPVTKIHATFEEAKKFYDENKGSLLLWHEEAPSISDLARGTRNLIVGEPGIGKSLLLEKLRDHFATNGFSTCLVLLRQGEVDKQIDDFLGEENIAPKALFLDALDEVRTASLPGVLQKIEEVSVKYPSLPIFISSRWVFINRYAATFSTFRFITVAPFSREQVWKALVEAGHSEMDIQALLSRTMSFSHSMLVIQIPRYLDYFIEFLKKNDIKRVVQFSRNELFEHLIQSKLVIEDEKLNVDERAIIKRVLEKLALTMEIYQTNNISKDELMTFLDDLKSDLKVVALSQISLARLFHGSILRLTGDDLDRIEFDNTEFQEYLAAKEITRFSDPKHAASSFAVNPEIKQIYNTWFNALTFLVDMQPGLLEQFVEFSGLRSQMFGVAAEEFIHFLSRIDPRFVLPRTKDTFLRDLVLYHQKNLQWIPGELTSSLPPFFNSTSETFLKGEVDVAEKEVGTKRFVSLGNVAYVVGYLLRDGVPLDRAYWREKLIAYASDTNENGVLQRHALFALEQLKDPTVINELPSALMNADDLVSQGFLSIAAELDPDNPKSLEYFFEATRRNDFHGRYGIFALKKPESIKKFLQQFNTDDRFRKEFLDDTSVFGKEDNALVKNIEAVFDHEIEELCKDALVHAAHYNVAHTAEKSSFVLGLWELLKKKDPGFIPSMPERIKNSADGASGLYFSSPFFAKLLGNDDVDGFIDAMIAIGERDRAHSVMVHIKRSGGPLAEKVYETGRAKLSDEYARWEAAATAATPVPDNRLADLIKEFRILLEPEPGKYSNNVFDFYVENLEALRSLLTDDDKIRLKDLITGTVFKLMNPADYELTITKDSGGSKTWKTSTAVHIFGDALIAATHLDIEITPFRQKILSFIPFAYTDQLKAIFELVKAIEPNEIAPVIEVYKQHKSDLWRHQSISFIEAVEQYHVVEAAPILREIVRESGQEDYPRRSALEVAESLLSDSTFLQGIFSQYEKSDKQIEVDLAHLANGLLITAHADSEAIKWRLNQILERVAPLVQQHGVHSVGPVEDEITHTHTFAKPLMQLSHRGYEENYLKLLEGGMEIWAKGEKFHAYASYIWDIICAYFDNLKKHGQYQPLRLLEAKVVEIKDKDGANWFASRMATLRRSYLAEIGKPHNISEAIQKYNDARARHSKKIANSDELFQYLQKGLDTDLQRWIEGEGAYELIVGKSIYRGQQQYEKLVQRTIKTQIENILFKQGFTEADIVREPQLLDDKRTDLLVRYGFVGPVVIEIKLTSSSEIKGKDLKKSKSYSSMVRYMSGYGATHGIFLVIDNKGAKNLDDIKGVFGGIPGVWVRAFKCLNYDGTSKTKRRVSKKKTSRKKS